MKGAVQMDHYLFKNHVLKVFRSDHSKNEHDTGQ